MRARDPSVPVNNTVSLPLQHPPDDAGRDISRRKPRRRGLQPLRRETASSARDAVAADLGLVDDLIGRDAVRRTGAWLHLRGHDLALSASEQAVAERILPLLRATPLEPPWVRDIARGLDPDEAELRALLRRMAGQGQLFQIVRDLFFVPEALEQLAATVRDLEAEQGGARARGLS